MLSIILINLHPVDITFPEPYALDSALSSGYYIFIQCLNNPGVGQCQLLVSNPQTVQYTINNNSGLITLQ